MLEQILLQIEGLEWLFQPIFDTNYFGCPDSCILRGSEQHLQINILFSPATLIAIIAAVGVLIGLVIRYFIKSARKRKASNEKILESLGVAKEKKEGFPIKSPRFRSEKKEFLRKYPAQVDPQQAYDSWISNLDSSHPQTDYIKSVHTETKEANLTPPEQKMLDSIKEEPEIIDKEMLEKEVGKVHELMKREHLTENEAVEKVIQGSTKQEEELTDIQDDDIFSQDQPPKKPLPAPLTKLMKIIKIPEKKNKETIKILTDLGTKRRDEYAEIINQQLLKWVYPLERYEKTKTDPQGKITTEIQNEIGDEEINQGLTKLALFLSMGEFMADQKHKKKRYWREVPFAR